jgi:hypothetical protein
VIVFLLLKKINRTSLVVQPAIPATREAEIRRIVVQSNSRKKFSRIPSQQISQE